MVTMAEAAELRRPYESHEQAYVRLRRTGGKTWDDLQKKVPSSGSDGIDSNDRRFLEGVLVQPWAPRSGLVVEMGCGTGPMVRWFCKRGFRGLGVDISQTAVEMGREQSVGHDLVLRQGDVCADDLALRTRQKSFWTDTVCTV